MYISLIYIYCSLSLVRATESWGGVLVPVSEVVPDSFGGSRWMQFGLPDKMRHEFGEEFEQFMP